MLDDEHRESPLEGDFFYNPRADLVAQRERIEHTYWEMIMVMSVDEIKAEIERVRAEQAKAVADIEAQREALREQRNALGKGAGKMKTSHAARLRKLHAELGAAVLDEAD